MTLRLGLCGPLWTKALLPFLAADEEDVPSGLGGQPVAALAQGFLERGVELVVVTLDPDVTDEVIVEGPGLRLCVGPYRPRHRARDAFRVERQYIASAIRREQPDVVHAHWTYEFALGALASGRPTLTTIHDWSPAILRYHPDPYRAVRLLMQLETLRRGTHFTAVSPYIAQRVRRWTGQRPTVVPNALPEILFDDTPRVLDAEQPVLVAANAGFDRLKNVRTLVSAFAAVRTQLPGATLVLLGNDYGKGGRAHRWALAREMAAGVTFQGPVAPHLVAEAFRGAHLLVHPSLEESFGLVLLEAMAQGLPVLAGARSGAVPWVLDDGQAGVLADVQSSDQLAAAIIAVLGDTVRWSELSNKGYEHAWASFRREVVLDRLWDLYRGVLEESLWARC